MNNLLEHIDIELTRECDNSCIHCSAGKNTKGDELTVDKIKGILEEAKILGLRNVGFTGGEPFLRREKLYELSDFCKNELNTQIHIHSNGTNISVEDANWSKQLGADITISLFGADSKTHDSITETPGSLDKALRGLLNLIDADAKLIVFIVPMRLNYKEILPLIIFLSNKGVRNIRILSLSPTGKALEKYDQLELNNKEMISLSKELKKAQKETKANLSAGFCTRQSYPYLKVLEGHSRCYAAENRIHIDAFGNVFPCTAASGRMIFSVGNLQMSAYTLTELWNASPFFQFLRRFHSNPPTKCQACTQYQNCMSGCRVLMAHKYRDITIPDPKCKGPYKNS